MLKVFVIAVVWQGYAIDAPEGVVVQSVVCSLMDGQL
jgi:hypothetical protein